MMCEVCNYEDNRGKMIIICPVCLTNNKLAERKQGALEELKRLYKSISVFHAENSVELKLIENRIKELEKEGVEK